MEGVAGRGGDLRRLRERLVLWPLPLVLVELSKRIRSQL